MTTTVEGNDSPQHIFLSDSESSQHRRMFIKNKHAYDVIRKALRKNLIYGRN